MTGTDSGRQASSNEAADHAPGNHALPVVADGPEPEPTPPHLAAALRAAAGAREHAARIRARQRQFEARAAPRWQPRSGSQGAGVLQPGPYRATRGQTPRFSRTVAAAAAARARTAEGDDPWHLRLRDDVADGRAGGWLGRLLNPLVGLRRRSAPDQERSAVPLPAPAADRVPAAAAQDGALTTQPPASAMAASTPRWPAIQPGSACPRGPGGLRSPLPGGREGRSPEPAATFDQRVRSPEPATTAASAISPRACATPERPTGQRPIDLLLLPAPHWRSSLTPGPGRDLASAAAARRGGETGPLRHPIIPIERRADRSPAPRLEAPHSRLADALAGKPPAIAGPGEDATAWRRSEPPTVARRRTAARRNLVVAVAVAGAFVLGLCADNRILKSGVEFGAALLGWSGPAPARPALPASAQPARSAHRTGPDLAPTARAPISSPRGRPPAAAGGTPWDVLYARGHHLQLEGKLRAAAEAYRQAIQANPQQAAVLYDLGYVLQLQGATEAAIGYYRRALAQQPQHAFAHYNLGTLLQAKGDAHAAIAHYKEAAAIESGNPYIYYDWARALEAAGDPAGAAALYRKAIALDPGHRPGLDARQRLAALAPSAADRAP